MATPLLSLRDVRVQYGRFTAVDGVSFELHAGQLLGMIGPNGAGKTTTLRAAAGLQPVSTGDVRVLGHDVFRAPTAVGAHLAFTPDTPAVYDTMVVVDFLRFIARCYGLPRSMAEERIDHWLAELWLTDKKNARISALSRGMRQRLAVARSLMPDPHVILMDEPAAGLDPAGRAQFRQLLASLRDQGKVIIVSSHILADLSEYCTHIAIMEQGRLREFGPVAKVAGAGHEDLSRYRIVLAARVGDVHARLAEVADIRRVETTGDTIELDYSGAREDAARLLARLIAAGLPVAEFKPLAPDLEQVYLRQGIRQVE